MTAQRTLPDAAAATIARLTTEREFQRTVLDLAHALGWRAYHTWMSARSAAGFPDLVLVRRGRIVIAELKSERGKLTAAQAAWLADLSDCPVEVCVWRPSEWDKIRTILEGD